MHQRPQLIAALSSIAPIPISGLLYRSIAEASLHTLSPAEPLYSLGARRNGQRFTPKTGPACLYLSEQFDVSYIETNGTAWSIKAGGHTFAPPPTVIISIKVEIEKVLDLTIPTVQDALGTHDDELAGPWSEQMMLKQPIPTHDLARVAHLSDRFQAIRFKSAQRPGAINVMVWTKKLSEPSFIEVNDPSKRLQQRIPKT